MVAPMTPSNNPALPAKDPSHEAQFLKDLESEGWDVDGEAPPETPATAQDPDALRAPNGDPLDLDSRQVFYAGGTVGEINARGFWKMDREGMPYCVHPLPLWPVEIIEAVTQDGGTSVYIRVRFARVHGGVGELKLPLGELGGFGRKDHALVRAGWKPPSSKRSGAVEETLTYAIKELAELGQLPTRMGYEIAGWVDHRTHVRPGADLYVGQTLGSTATKGSRDVWAKTVTELMDDSGICAFVVACALGSLFRGVVPLPHSTSHIVNLTGAPSRGKTTMLKVIASIAGVMEKPLGYVEGASTLRGLENRLGACNHGWVLVDEIDQLLMGDVDGGSTKLMFMANGGGREKASQSGGSIQGVTWTVTIISTGNKALLDMATSAKKGEALTTRIFELDILDADLTTFAERSELTPRQQRLAENYGWGYPAAVEAIASSRAEWIQRFYEIDVEQRSNPRLAPIFDDQARLLAFFELALLGAELAEKVISPRAGAAAMEAVGIAMARYEQEPEQGITQSLHRQHKLLLDLHEWLSFNAGRFVWKGYAWKEPTRAPVDTNGDTYAGMSEGERQAEQARYLTSIALGGGRGALGQVKQVRAMKDDTDFEGELVLGAAALDELERVAKIDRAELTTAAKAFGLLQTNEKDRDGYKLSGALKAQLGGGSRGLKLLLRKPDLAEQARAMSAVALKGAWRPTRWADDTGTPDLWAEQDSAALEAVANDNAALAAQGYTLDAGGDEDAEVYIPGFDDEEDARRAAAQSAATLAPLFGEKP
ncbi:DUF927 domain-containing protein [Pseudoxanthomonas sp. Root630]|uniref:DUF927 domain-containing protein n=1 Tax=Pseudoxanthomonas sp. Root630 TaxID=1736574 RepID=UPI0009D7329E|nr:DUF927 domain-containing protein [Pseudoxanthomonas sp. Root630]